MVTEKPKAILLFGATASGKTDLAIKIAKKFNGEIINADSRQFYKEMPIITAMPSAEEFAAAKHHLFDCLEVEDDFSVVKYLNMAKDTSEKIIAKGKLPIIVGGTGMYLRVLEQGISPIPETDKNVLKELEKLSTEKLFIMLCKEDLEMSEKLKPNDRQRIIRALAILQQTGKRLLQWQKEKLTGALEYDFIHLVINPPREVLYDRINTRAAKMLDLGLMKEVEHLHNKYGTKRENALTSIGFDIFCDFFENKISEQEAIEKFAQKQRNYAKRQLTWLKNQYKTDLEHKDLEVTFEFLQKRLK
ncbi:MAG: tRNA (adenosine(37)-N6)-dimethylallyltransferase MiaA [Proteobacteria bacterium]|nr:tRNA (adenosine(37)-N6)-dimethylallyltransferase MiaA [Pseudomonadota bacterium]